ncbi:RNA polymerase sigma-70 factor (ECF subfamily) [Winogradskyella eximia]|jgi:RNA polymerase sigma-70 factor, ECF subfamily|uniref:RNA polymerase sigma-70 factor (ECF subfamily) n=1 Tax=Winogradskyella eximia TaxID=262006 RepID=A0A3D9H7M9_9FLAO|nr:RNA polymerase sigma factor [Winogradskyella eximia]RED45494.1 RNA polymerase sigma-70 factor (ECF subfamily) [Winogradskyella eximia]
MSKLVSINQNVSELVGLAQKSNQKAQLALYDTFSGKMLGVCRQYIKDLQFAEDVMITSFHKAFQNINKYEPYGSFEGWLRRIMVRECISYLRIQKNKFNVVEIGDYYFTQPVSTTDNSTSEIIQNAVDQLPIGCKTIFNLYVIEGYKHREISELLNVSIGTSKSQLAHAKKLLKSSLANLNNTENGTQ